MQKLNIKSRILYPNNPLYIGSSSYDKLRQAKHCIIDKSLLIKEYIEDGEEAVIITRPRRFGKSMNMSMLKCFFEKPLKNNIQCKDIFEGTLISEEKDIMEEHFHKYPVIYLDFKEIRQNNWEDCLKEIRATIRDEVERHIIENNIDLESLRPSKKEVIGKILKNEADLHEWGRSLYILSKVLSSYFKKKTIILIDEYDTPINHLYLQTNQSDINNEDGYFMKILSFMRTLLNKALKGNDYLYKGLLVGILRLSKESFLTGLNNSGVSDVTGERYKYHYGFTENEVVQLLKHRNLFKQFKEVKRWYNGYMFGSYENIYNPWSIARFVKKGGKFNTYWLNTSGNELLIDSLKRSDVNVKRELMTLIKEKGLRTNVDIHTSLRALSGNKNQIWGLLLAAGYITLGGGARKKFGSILTSEIRLPNYEVEQIYTEFISKWFDSNWQEASFNDLILSLEEGEIDQFTNILQEQVMNNISFFDVKESKNPEDISRASISCICFRYAGAIFREVYRRIK